MMYLVLPNSFRLARYRAPRLGFARGADSSILEPIESNRMFSSKFIFHIFEFSQDSRFLAYTAVIDNQKTISKRPDAGHVRLLVW